MADNQRGINGTYKTEHCVEFELILQLLNSSIPV